MPSMKTKNRGLIPAILTSLALLASSAQAQVVNKTPVVENITASQIVGTKHLEIFYDLTVSDSHPCNVTVKWSTDNGDTYPQTAVTLTGEAGPGIAPGQGKRIVWDMGVDWDNQFTQTGRIQITASRTPDASGTGDSSDTDGNSVTGD